ncbi:hypothetical protein N7513_003926 [Penicillium frequentans]|nr:hypothetical protein N7513_003926 [Penicillium glabrum]
MDSAKQVSESFTKALPKVELHAHLSGSISRQCLHEIWKNKKSKYPNFPVEDPLVLMPAGVVDYTLQTFFQVFSKLIYQLCNDLESLAYATNSVLEDFHSDGVRYLELRTIPRASPNTNITREEYLTTVLDTISTFKSRTGNQMSVFLILALDRGNTTATEAQEIIDLAISNKPRGGCRRRSLREPDAGRRHYIPAKAHGLGLTLHFAETPASGARDELAALLSFQPDRLGHVIHVPDDVKAEIVKRGLGLELCMSCNVHAKLIDGGFWITILGPGGMRIARLLCVPVSNEYLLAAQHFGLDRGELVKICQKSVNMIFGGEEEKQRLRGILDNFAGSMLIMD